MGHGPRQRPELPGEIDRNSMIVCGILDGVNTWKGVIDLQAVVVWFIMVENGVRLVDDPIGCRGRQDDVFVGDCSELEGEIPLRVLKRVRARMAKVVEYVHTS